MHVLAHQIAYALRDRARPGSDIESEAAVTATKIGRIARDYLKEWRRSGAVSTTVPVQHTKQPKKRRVARTDGEKLADAVINFVFDNGEASLEDIRKAFPHISDARWYLRRGAARAGCVLAYRELPSKVSNPRWRGPGKRLWRAEIKQQEV